MSGVRKSGSPTSWDCCVGGGGMGDGGLSGGAEYRVRWSFNKTTNTNTTAATITTLHAILATHHAKQVYNAEK